MSARMYQAVSGVPGFIRVEQMSAPDGRDLAIAYFESEEAIRSWYFHPEHRTVQQAARDGIFDDYTMEICEMVRTYTKRTSRYDPAAGR